MKFLFCFIFSLTTFTAFCQIDEVRLEKALFNLPNVSFKKINEQGQKYLKYDLQIRQPLDHSHPESGFFYQRVILTHKSFNSPTVMETQGYWINTFQNEIEQIFDANNLNIEHRFYGKSYQDSITWKYLTIEQATKDLHSINQIFREIYKGKWISTGISKGGSNSIYYKYFFPEDVDLTIPYVAPIPNGIEDKRIYTFLDTIGQRECRTKIKNFQLFLLNHENEIIDKLKWYSKASNLHYTYTGSIGKSFEYAVLEYSFSFWQYNSNCESIPTNEVVDDYLTALLLTSDIYSFTDEGIELLKSHYYQAATEFGYYGYKISPFKKSLHYVMNDSSAILFPKSVVINPYDNSLNIKVQNWLFEKGNNIVYIYGGLDTWTAARVPISNKVNSKQFIVPNKNHATAQIKNMSPSMQQQIVDEIKKIVDLKIDLELIK